MQAATAAAAAAVTTTGRAVGPGTLSQKQQQKQLQQGRGGRVPLSDVGGVTKAVEGGDIGSSKSTDSDNNNENMSLYTLMGLCFLVAVVCALDRVAMSVAIVPMGNVYDYSDTTKGLVSTFCLSICLPAAARRGVNKGWSVTIRK